MQSFVAAQANTVYVDMLQKTDGEPITTGTVNFYLIALTGANAGKWFRTSDDSWQVTEVIAGVGTHQAVGHWSCSIDTAAWIAGVRYELYGRETGDLQIDYSEEVSERSLTETSNITVETTVIE